MYNIELGTVIVSANANALANPVTLRPNNVSDVYTEFKEQIITTGLAGVVFNAMTDVANMNNPADARVKWPDKYGTTSAPWGRPDDPVTGYRAIPCEDVRWTNTINAIAKVRKSLLDQLAVQAIAIATGILEAGEHAIIKRPVKTHTIAALPTYVRIGNTIQAVAAGAFPLINGKTVDIGDRFLLNNGADDIDNGIWTPIDLGSVTTNFILLRVADFDDGKVISKGTVVVESDGSDVAAWAVNSDEPMIVGQSAITWGLIVGGTSYVEPPVMGSARPWVDLGRAHVVKAEGPTVAASATYTMLDVSGAGHMSHFFMTINGSDTAGRQNTRVKIYVNSEGSPSVDVMLVDLACARDVEAAGGAGAATANFKGTYTGYTSLAFSIGVGYYIYIKVPFATRLKIDIVNGSATNSIVLGGYVQYYIHDNINWGKYRKLHGVSLNGLSVAAYAEQNLLNVSYGGVLHGVYLNFNGGDNNYNYLEGNIYGYIDGEGTASIQYDSTEDYFEHGWYFWDANITRNTISQYVGCTRKNDGDIISAYRWHIEDPIPFSTGFRLTWFNGEAIAATVTNNTVVHGVIWHYEE